MGGVMNSIGWLVGGMCRLGRVYFLLLAACPPPASLLLNVKARAERAALHLCGGRSLCCLLQAGEEKPWCCARASQGLGAPACAAAHCDGQWTAGAGATNSHAGSPQACRGNCLKLSLLSCSPACKGMCKVGFVVL